MKRLLTIFELTKNEQRVVLIILFVLFAVAFIRYERRVHHAAVQPIAASAPTPSPSPFSPEE
jgi:hypothetical protein